jgi:hypothetical protein
MSSRSTLRGPPKRRATPWGTLVGHYLASARAPSGAGCALATRPLLSGQAASFDYYDQAGGRRAREFPKGSLDQLLEGMDVFDAEDEKIGTLARA